jgi:phosphoglycerate dehydrogenase-like enzyme
VILNMSIHSRGIQHILTTLPLSPSTLANLRKAIPNVHHYPNPPHSTPQDILPQIDVLFTITNTLPALHLSDFPNLKLLQLASAGADGLLNSGFLDQGNVPIATASGTHVLSIPNWVVGSVIALYHQLPAQILHARVSTPTLSYIADRERRIKANGL